MDGKTLHTAPAEDLLASLGEFLKPDLARVDAILSNLLHEAPDNLIREVGRHVFAASGKRLRPSLTLLAARATGEIGAEPPAEIAAAMEAIHVATLIHDDVIDKAEMRRKQPSVNARWGDDVAILMADYLYAAAFELALHRLDPSLLQIICQVTRRMCEGELFQIERRGNALDVEEYIKIVTGKTAALFSACAAIGALAAGAEPAAVERLTRFGLDFGLAFQITDDTLDYIADGRVLGKPNGADFAAGKQTLPYILAHGEAGDADRRRLEALLAQGRDLAAMNALLQKYNAIERALDMARSHALDASRHLDGIVSRDGAAMEYLAGLPAYVSQRSF